MERLGYEDADSSDRMVSLTRAVLANRPPRTDAFSVGVADCPALPGRWADISGGLRAPGSGTFSSRPLARLEKADLSNRVNESVPHLPASDVPPVPSSMLL